MEAKQLLIPTKIRVGFQNRTDTYTKKLAYVIYYDTKGKIRKEGSWQSWRDKSIDPVEFDNKPTEGFVLNKNVGGYKSDWNYRSAHIRVYDPRDFEFEISLENLLYILSCGDCTRGKGLEGKFVYAWDGTELVLLPEESQNYKNSTAFTNLQNLSVKAKTLVAGHSYITKKQVVLVYIGKLDCYSAYNRGYRPEPLCVKIHVFWNEAQKCWSFPKDMKELAAVQSDVVVPNYAELRSAYHNSIYGTPISKIEIVPITVPIPNNDYNRFFATTRDGTICRCAANSHRPDQTTTESLVRLINGRIEEESYYKYSYRKKEDGPTRNSGRYYGYYDVDRVLGYWIPPAQTTIKATFESGAEYQYSWRGTFSTFADNKEILEENEIEEND